MAKCPDLPNISSETEPATAPRAGGFARLLYVKGKTGYYEGTEQPLSFLRCFSQRGLPVALTPRRPRRYSSPLHRKSAFTLVELLVVIAIIGMLVSIVLPAVQAAREAGRRTECANNLRNLVQASLSHETGQGYYPAGGYGYRWIGDPDRGFGRQQPGGWTYSVLPFIEQQDLYELGKGLTGSARQQAMETLLTTPVQIFYCPSRRPVGLYASESTSYRNDDAPSGIGQVVKCDYAINGGTEPYERSRGLYGGPNSYKTLRLQPFPDPTPSNGLSWWATTFSSAHVEVDGTTSTFLLGHKGFDANYEGGPDAGEPQNPYVGHDPDVMRLAGQGYPLRRDRDRDDGYVEWSFGSPHTSGVPFAFCDGHVQWIRLSINLETLDHLANRRDGKKIDVGGL